MQINRLAWDSEFLGFEVGSFFVGSDKSIIEFDPKHFDLIYFLVDPENLSAINFLLNAGALLVDEKVTFIKKVQAHSINCSDIVAYQSKGSDGDNDVIQIGLQSGEYSRFKIDPKFPPGTYERLYKRWMENSISLKIAQAIFVYQNSMQVPLGVITLGEKNGAADIGILAVDESARGQQIGNLLVQKAENFSYAQGYKNLQVVTQLANQRACRFYEKCNFKINSIVNIYHLWKEK